LGFAAGTKTIRITTDGGTTWTAACLPDGAQFVQALAARGQKAWAAGVGEQGGSGFILRSTDGGRVWRPAQVPAEATYLMDIAFPDDDHGWAVGRRPQTDPAYGDQYGGGALLLRSTDGGATWKLGQDFSPDVAGGLIRLSFPDPDHGWASGQTRGNTAALLATSDGGDNWRAQALPAEVREIHHVVFVDAAHGWITAELGPVGADSVGGILATTDGGATWTTQWQASQTPVSALWFADRDHGWAVANPAAGGTVLSTIDGGATWTATLTPGRSLSTISFAGTRQGWVAGQQGAFVYATTDGGASWESRPITGP
ncbi:MAG TPA: YCF48-related protein, partial [Acidimicrobiia bacterium]